MVRTKTQALRKSKPKTPIDLSLPAPILCRNLEGHAQELTHMLDLYTKGHMHHAYIIHGLANIGKASFAYYLSKLLLTGTSGPHLPTDCEGEQIVNLIENQAHPNLLTIEPELNPKTSESQSNITVDQIRAMQSFLQTSSLNQGNAPKIVVIDTINNLNRGAANAILKMLEEPLPGRLFLLVCHNPSKIADTIKSRCNTLALKPLTQPEQAKIIARWKLLPDQQARVQTLPSSYGSLNEVIWLLKPACNHIYTLCSHLIEHKNLSSIEETAEAASQLTNTDFIALVELLLTSFPIPEQGSSQLKSKTLSLKQLLADNKVFNLDKKNLITCILLDYVI